MQPQRFEFTLLECAELQQKLVNGLDPVHATFVSLAIEHAIRSGISMNIGTYGVDRLKELAVKE